MENTREIQAVKNRFEIIGNAPALNYALSVAIQVAPTDLTVLINGESGSGKESFSKIIHGLSKRSRGNFIAINCGAIPEGTIDSELFGHVKGAFTSAHEDRKGYFETTNHGTIFLDEIGEMPLGTQSRLLRVLENGEYIPVGSSTVKKTDVRVVAATNVDLLQAVEAGRFREDLYYRLNTVPIKVPPLRDRGFDIELLFRKFTSDFAEKNQMEPVDLTGDAMAALKQFRFPGNIRQLKNITEQITLLESERLVNLERLQKYLPADQSSGLPALFHLGGGGGDVHGISERELLYKVLFDMRKDITDLKALVYSLMSGDKAEQVYNPELFRELTQPVVYPKAAEEYSHFTPQPDSYELEPEHKGFQEFEDISKEPEEEGSLSLEKKEKEMIIKALKRNGFKRKYAAQSLGISERTLYRKIKQYDIVNEEI